MRSTRITKRGAGSGGPAGFSDDFSLAITASDSILAPSDDATFALALLQADTIDVQSETVSLAFPAPDFADLSVAPTDTNIFTLRVWLSGGTATANGVTNVASSNGQNDAAVATIQSAIAGTADPSITSALGANVPTATITAALYRGWFKSVNTLVTSNGNLVMHSTTAAFTDKTMFTNAALNTTVDHLSGDFTYDLFANGIDTLAKLQSCQMIHNTHDAAAGVTPHVLTVDAGCIEISGAFT